LDRRGERAVYGLRLGAAALTFLGSLWLALLGPSTLGWVVVGLGILATVGWVVSFERARRRDHDRHRYYLDLAGDRLTLAEGAELHTIPWNRIVEVNVDEDRLAVVVTQDGGAPLRIEPRYGALGIYELAERLRLARGLATNPVDA